jgi:hypothetical protein
MIGSQVFVGGFTGGEHMAADIALHRHRITTGRRLPD